MLNADNHPQVLYYCDHCGMRISKDDYEHGAGFCWECCMMWEKFSDYEECVDFYEDDYFDEAHEQDVEDETEDLW